MCPICHTINYSNQNNCTKCGILLKKEFNQQSYSSNSLKDSDISKRISHNSDSVISDNNRQSAKKKDPVFLTISTYRITQEAETLIDAIVYFPHICFSGRSTTIVFIFINRQDALIEDLEINIQSAGISNTVKHKGFETQSNLKNVILIG